MRIVLDTSSLVTAIRSSQGASAEVLRLALIREVVLLMDYKLASEYRDVVLRPEHVAASGKREDDLADLIDTLEGLAEPVEIVTSYRPLSTDPNDDMVLDVAINGRAKAIVTQNVKHFVAGEEFGVAVLTPAELLQGMREER